MYQQSIFIDFEEATEKTLSAFTDFPEKHFGVKPAPNSWSAGEIAGHLVVLENMVAHVLEGPVQNTDRDPAKRVETIANVFERDDRKYHAPEPVQPGPDLLPLAEALEALADVRKKLKETLAKSPLEDTCLGFKHFFFGELTRLEWGYFVVYHSNRHLRQLDRVKAMVSG